MHCEVESDQFPLDQRSFTKFDPTAIVLALNKNACFVLQGTGKTILQGACN